MRCVWPVKLHGKQFAARVIVLVILLCLISAAMLSEIFILTHGNHEHDHNGVGDSCATCAQLQYAETTLKQFGVALASVGFIITGLFSTIFVVRAPFLQTAFATLISLKTRLNN